MIWHFLVIFAVATKFVQTTSSQSTTITVGNLTNQTGTITATPTIGQPVELRCVNSEIKQWYITGSEVTPTNSTISTRSGATRILAFSSFIPSYAGTYTCLLSSRGDTQTKTTFPVVLVNPSAINTITVGRADNATTPITITPTLSQPVKLVCNRTENWYTNGTSVTPTSGELNATNGIIFIPLFNTTHARGYTCSVNGSSPHTYPVLLETPPAISVISPPSQVEGVKAWKNETSLTVTWDKVESQKYNKITCKILYVMRYSINHGNETDPPSDAMKRSGITNTSTTVTLTQFLSNTTYYVWVAAEILGAGVQGNYSMRVNATSHDDTQLQKTLSQGTTMTFGNVTNQMDIITPTATFGQSIQKTSSQITTATVGNVTNQMANITVIPSIGQSVQNTASQATTATVGNLTDHISTITPMPTIGQSAQDTSSQVTTITVGNLTDHISTITPTPTIGQSAQDTSSKVTTITVGNLTDYISTITPTLTICHSMQTNTSQATTITVGNSSNQFTTITITPSIGQSVELQCDNGSRFKQWYITGSEVMNTSCEISTLSGVTRKLAFTSFVPSYAGTYTCLASSKNDTQTKTTFPVVLVNPSAINTITVGKTDNATIPITITPTLSQPVKLVCNRTGTPKNWYTNGTAVTSTSGELNATNGIISISSFNTTHARGYTCSVNGSYTYPVVLETPPAVTTLPPPPQVQGVKTCKSGTSVNVSWTALTVPKYNNVVKKILYVVRYSTDSSNETDPPSDAMKRSGITNASTTLTQLLSNTTYYVWVAAEILGAGVQGPYSMKVARAFSSISSKVSVFPKVMSNQPSLHVNWSAPKSDCLIQYYQVDYRVGNSGSWSIWIPNPTSTSVILTDLQKGTTYQVRVRAVSEVGNGTWSDTANQTTSDVATALPNSITIAIIAGIAAVPLVLIIVVVVLCIVVLKKQQQKKHIKHMERRRSETQDMATSEISHFSDNHPTTPEQSQTEAEDLMSIEMEDISMKLDSRNDVVDEPFYEDISKHIPRSQFAAYVRKMRMENNGGFKKEYNIIQNDPKGVDIIAKEHKKKNRYVNIHTFDHSRVVLSVPDENESDYINASYIDGFERRNAYIASQGPKPNTILDFWQMIWDHRPPVLVMLTQLKENGRKKCDCYWNNDIEQNFEPGRGFRIKVMSCRIFADFEVREMLVKNMSDEDSNSFIMSHFLYTGWPDHGVPQHPSSLIQFIKKIRKVYRNSPSPLIVHCSAGVGRTGTYITIDAMLQRLKKRDDLNIYDFVTEMRSKRTYMVQSQEQYEFIYNTLNDYLICGGTAVPAHELRRRIIELEALQGQEVTGFQFEFDTLSSVSKSVCNDDLLHSQIDQVAWKNRYKDRFPYYLNYLHISGRTSENDHDYFNASFINSHSRTRAFIAAQSPLMHTRNDFWEVVWQLQTSVIVFLCDSNEKEQEHNVQFWPSGNVRTVEFSFVKVDLMHADDNQGYTTYSFIASDKRKPDSSSLGLTLFHSSDWRTDGPVQVSPLLRMIADIERKRGGSDKPVIIMCDDGMGRTGVLITVMSEIERVKSEKEVDIFQTVKAIRVQRPNMVSTVEQYKLCYEMLQAYLDSYDNYANFKAM